MLITEHTATAEMAQGLSTLPHSDEKIFNLAYLYFVEELGAVSTIGFTIVTVFCQ
jgi:hypothetical protein